MNKKRLIELLDLLLSGLAGCGCQLGGPGDRLEEEVREDGGDVRPVPGPERGTQAPH